ncbi:MAG: hypothetical protein KAV87_68240 [Desulfobacteraceae bacterium]|nr:hypothetical protein [Desulfobacteraceae bacterium]
MKNGSVNIGTWPTPERPLTVEIPTKLLQEFKKDPRFVLCGKRLELTREC